MITEIYEYFSRRLKSTELAINPLSSHFCITASFYIHENRINFPTTKGFKMKISMKLVYNTWQFFSIFSLTSNHFYPLQVENCDSNSRLVEYTDDNGKLMLERVKEIINVWQQQVVYRHKLIQNQ